MSHSQLFKAMMMNKFAKEYVFVVMLEERKNGLVTIKPLQICETVYEAMQSAIKYNVNEFYGRYIVSKTLLKILSKNNNSAEVTEQKYKAIKNEYTTLFDADPNYNFKIYYKAISKSSNFVIQSIKRRAHVNHGHNRNLVIRDYVKFYNYFKKQYKLAGDDIETGSLVSFMK
jgi:hypothetical protein